MKRLWIGLAILILLSPLGLILPAKFGAGTAWGEWSKDEVHRMVGYAPAGMTKLADRWKAPLPDYGFKHQENGNQNVSYILSGIVGVVLVIGASMLLGRVLAKRERD